MTDGPQVVFWGVRGSIATPGPLWQRYGGNTSCVEIRCGDHTLIMDAGTGLRRLGQAMMGNGRTTADILLSHTHFDHICGMPFFAPFYSDRFTFRLSAGHLLPNSTVNRVMCEMMKAPLFPVPPSVFGANVSYHDFTCGETLEPKPGIKVRTGPLNHPNGATGYRIEFAGRAVCYITDTEHTGDGPDPNIVDLVRDADVMIYDSTYTDAEYPRFKGWGHSTWQEAIRVSDAANVATCVLFHHDPTHEDTFMDDIARQAAEMRPGTLVAREGMVLQP